MFAQGHSWEVTSSRLQAFWLHILCLIWNYLLKSLEMSNNFVGNDLNTLTLW